VEFALVTSYCKGTFEALPLEPNEQPMTFIEFLGQVLMSNEGARKDKQWIKDIEEKINEITKLYEVTSANSTNN